MEQLHPDNERGMGNESHSEAVRLLAEIVEAIEKLDIDLCSTVRANEQSGVRFMNAFAKAKDFIASTGARVLYGSLFDERIGEVPALTAPPEGWKWSKRFGRVFLESKSGDRAIPFCLCGYMYEPVKAWLEGYEEVKRRQL